MITISCPLILPPMNPQCVIQAFFVSRFFGRVRSLVKFYTVALISTVPFAGVFLHILLPNAALKWLN